MHAYIQNIHGFLLGTRSWLILIDVEIKFYQTKLKTLQA